MYRFPTLTRVAIFVVAVQSFAGCGGKKEEARTPPPPAAGAAMSKSQLPIIPKPSRRPAPEIASASLDGRQWLLSERRGKIVVVDFWATWCGPCRMTIPHMIDLQREFGPRGLEVVGISLDTVGNDFVSSFVRQNGINYPIIVDAQSRYPGLFGGVQGIPTFFLIDREGKTAARVVGAVPKEYIQKAVEALLEEA